MKRILPIIAMVLFSAVPLFAQTENKEEKASPQIVFNDNNKAGDQYIRIALGPDFPVNFPSFDKLFSKDRKLNIGGMGTFGYHYFLTNVLSIGGQIGFGLNITTGEHVLNLVPVTFNTTFIPTINNFEFPISLGIGFSSHSYAGQTYFPGLTIQSQIGVDYKITPNWSVGFELGYLYLPEFNHLYNKEQSNVHAQFITTELVARYFF